jgi:hypothetical protein
MRVTLCCCGEMTSRAGPDFALFGSYQVRHLRQMLGGERCRAVTGVSNAAVVATSCARRQSPGASPA